MSEPVDPRDLLGGVASSTLSPKEREVLFTAALEDQSLFNELLSEEPLREVLSDEVARARLLANLTDDEKGSFVPRWVWAMRLAGAALAVLILGIAAYRLGDRAYSDVPSAPKTASSEPGIGETSTSTAQDRLPSSPGAPTAPSQDQNRRPELALSLPQTPLGGSAAREYGPLLSETTRQIADASTLAVTVVRLGTANIDLWQGDAKEQYDLASREIENARTRLEIATKSRSPDDFSDASAAAGRAKGILAALEQNLNARVNARRPISAVESIPERASNRAIDSPTDTDDAFKSGLNARGDREWQDVALQMRRAIQDDAGESTRMVRSGIGGLLRQGGTQYLPYFFLGEALFNLQDCVGAVGAWSRSEQQRAVRSRPDFLAILQNGYVSCEAKGVLPPSKFDPLLTRTTQNVTDVNSQANTVVKLGTANIDLWQGDVKEQYDRATGEIRSARARLEAATKSRSQSDFNEASAATERAKRILVTIEANLLEARSRSSGR